MDPMSIVGAVVGIGFILLGQILEGGHAGSLIQITAACIVFGGCFGAVLAEMPLPKFMEAVKIGLQIFKKAPDHSREYIEKIVDCATVVRKQGILALEPKLQEMTDPFFKKGLQLLIDGTEPRLIREMLEVDMIYREEHYEIGPKLFESAGGYMPTFGIIGAVIGLIHVMENLDEPSGVGAGIAVAFVATVYGLVAANILLLPAWKKLLLRGKLHGIDQQMIIEGLMSIAAGENPRLIEEKLTGFLNEAGRAKASGAEAAPAAAK